jgi:uncharacterized protein (DUF3820 family)
LDFLVNIDAHSLGRAVLRTLLRSLKLGADSLSSGKEKASGPRSPIALAVTGHRCSGLSENDRMSELLHLLVKTEMPYGKHKGALIADLPGNYLNWFAREGFPPGQLGRLLALMHEIDHNGLKHLLVPLRQTG